jgi:hypothetical protein
MMMRTEPLAEKTVLRKVRKANFGNVWVTEFLPDGRSTQDFYAVHVRVMRREGKLRLLQYDGSTVDVLLDGILDVSGERREEVSLDTRLADPNDPINRCDLKTGCNNLLFPDGTTLAQNDIVPDFCAEHDLHFHCWNCEWQGDLNTVKISNEQYVCPNCGMDESGMEIEGGKP